MASPAVANLVTPGTVAGVIGLLAALAAAFGKESLAAFLADPATAQSILAIISGVLSLVAGYSRGVAPAPVAVAPPVA